MNREKRKDALEFVGFVAIVASLIFLALEIRQARDAVLGTTYLARASAQEEWGKYIAESEYAVEVIVRYGESDISELSAVDQSRLFSLVEAAFHRMDGIYYQYELGLLTDEYYESTFNNLMSVWVPRWKDTGFLDRGWVVPRPSFQVEIDKHLDDPLLK